MIEYVKGDFIDGPEACIVHGCNAQGAMGRGAALAVKQRLPFAYKAYRSEHEKSGLVLGTVIWAVNDVGRPRMVGNAITQAHYAKSRALNGVNVDYDAVRACFRKINLMADLSQTNKAVRMITRIGMPKIGAGLGGGDWSIIERIINEESTSFTPVVYELTP